MDAPSPPFNEEQLAWLNARFPEVITASSAPTGSEAPSDETPGGVDNTAASSSLLPPTVPIFQPAAISNGLDILATVASKENLTNPTESLSLAQPQTKNLASTLSKPGPYSPAAALPTKVVKRILNLEFVEMSEITMDVAPSQSMGRPSPPRLPVTDISQWLERYSTMAAIIATRFPNKAPELFAYQALIVRAERNYESCRWVSYDRQFRREALARSHLNWSVPDARLYSEAFTGRARSIARCTYCLQDDHRSELCPRNPHRSFFSWLQDAALWSSFARPSFGSQQQPLQQQQPQWPGKSGEVCRRWNRGVCRAKGNCRHDHQCLGCGGEHPQSECLTNPPPQQGQGRTRPSPYHPQRGSHPYINQSRF